MTFDELVQQERDRQDIKWGEQNHGAFIWCAVLGEEFGEFQQACLQNNFGGPHKDEMLLELVQVSAVCKAIYECGERNGWWMQK